MNATTIEAGEKATANSLKVVQKLYLEFGRGDIQAVLDLLTDDIEWTVPGPTHIVPWTGVKYQGREQVTEYFKLIGETVEIDKFEQQDMIAQGEKVMAIFHEQARNKKTSRSYETAIVHSIVVRGQKVAKFDGYMETGPLIAAFLDRDF